MVGQHPNRALPDHRNPATNNPDYRYQQAPSANPVFGYKISYRRVLDVQARMLAAVMLGELREYVPMTTR